MTQQPEIHTFDKPDEIRNFSHGHLDVITTHEGIIGRMVFEPGWRWSQDVRPVAGTDLCQTRHVGYQVSGMLHVKMADGTEFDLSPGDYSVIPPDHDAWVVGDEPVVALDWGGATHYAKPAD